MSKIIPPLLSTTPPPIAGVLDEEDDEFGDFTLASNDLSYGCDSLSIPSHIETKTVEKDFQDRRKVDHSGLEDDILYNSSKINVTTVTSKFNNFQYFSDVPPDVDDCEENLDDDHTETSVPNNLDATCNVAVSHCSAAGLNIDDELSRVDEYVDNSLLDDSQNSNCTNTFNVDSDLVSLVNENLKLATDNSIDVALIEQSDIDTVVNPDLLIVTPIVVDENVAESESQLPEEDFGNFSCFDSNDDGQQELDIETKPNFDMDFGKFESQTFDEDEFGDFNNYDVQSPVELVSFTSLNEVNSIIADMFPLHGKVVHDYQKEDYTINDFVFNQIKDVTNTNALSYQWSKSRSQNCLLKSLNIDMRNILYGPRWNESMPRYAATLGFTPLEPTKTEIPSPTITEPTASAPASQPITTEPPLPQTSTDIPSAQFDWIGSGLENPLENSPASTMLLDIEHLVASLDIQFTPKLHLIAPNTNTPSPINEFDDWEFWLRLTPKEPLTKKDSDINLSSSVSIQTPTNAPFNPQPTSNLQSLDNESVKSLRLNEMEVVSSVDEEFDDFTSYQIENTINNIPSTWSPKSIPLRETHISYQTSEDTQKSTDEPGWLKPTILTPVLPRKEEEPNIHLRNDELSDWLQYQTVHRGVNNEPTPSSSIIIPVQAHLDSEIVETQLPGPQESIKQGGNVQIEQQAVEPSQEQINPLSNNIEDLQSNEANNVVDSYMPDSQLLQTRTDENQTVNSDDEFTDFQSSDVVVLPKTVPPCSDVLQPTLVATDILQPIKLESSVAVIDWPDPGISDDELKRFELSYQPHHKQNSVPDEDEWSEFVSNQEPTRRINVTNPKGPSNFKESRRNDFTVTESKPPQNGIQSLNNSHEVDDEWSDFVSGPPILPNGVHTAIPKLNMDWTRPPQFTSWASNVTPNIITNPVAFDSFQTFNAPTHIDLLKNRASAKKPSNVILQSKKNTIPSISSIPDLEFIVPKNHTWKK